MPILYTEIITYMKWGLPATSIVILSSLFWASEPVRHPTSTLDLSQIPTAAEIGIGAPEHYGSIDGDVTVFMTAGTAVLDNESVPNLNAQSYFASINSPAVVAPVEVTADIAYMVGRENRAALLGAVIVRLPDGQEVRSDELDFFFEDRVAEGRGRIHTQDDILEIYSDHLYLAWSLESDIETLQYTGRVRSIYIPKS